MNTLMQLLPRDSSLEEDDNHFGGSMGSLLFVFFALLSLGSALSISLLYLRRKRLAREHALLPRYHHASHQRSVSMTNIPTFGQNDSVFVYNEKMNLIANSSSPPTSAVPEIRVTFPEDEDHEGRRQNGRVVVVHVTDTGSVGMSPLNQEQLPPYQRRDTESFQTLELDRMGGLREKAPATTQQ